MDLSLKLGFINDPSGVAALYLGKREGKELVYLGKVGTGWSRTVSSQIRKQLETVSPKSKLTKPIKKAQFLFALSADRLTHRIFRFHPVPKFERNG